MIDDRTYRDLVHRRGTRPDLVKAAALPRPRPAWEHEHLLIVAADHPARGALGVGDRPHAMADRRDLLERIVRALSVPRVDGFLGSPDLIEELFLLRALDHKLVFGTMNRSGLAGSAWELDDRFTAHDAAAIERMELDGGKMLLRLLLDDPGTNRTITACAGAVAELAERGLVAMVEPLPALRAPDGRVGIATDVGGLVRAVSVASALGPTSAYTWLKLPPTDHLSEMLSATTLPALLLGGDPAGRWDAVLSRWRDAMRWPNVRGLVAGRGLLYPAGGDVEAAVGAASAIVHGKERT